MGHLNSFSASGGENLNKNFPKIQMPGRLPGEGGGGGCLSFDLTDTLCPRLNSSLLHFSSVTLKILGGNLHIFCF